MRLLDNNGLTLRDLPYLLNMLQLIDLLNLLSKDLRELLLRHFSNKLLFRNLSNLIRQDKHFLSNNLDSLAKLVTLRRAFHDLSNLIRNLSALVHMLTKDNLNLNHISNHLRHKLLRINNRHGRRLLTILRLNRLLNSLFFNNVSVIMRDLNDIGTLLRLDP